MHSPACNLSNLSTGLLQQSGGQWGYYTVQTIDVAPGPCKINASFEALLQNCVVKSEHYLL